MKPFVVVLIVAMAFGCATRIDKSGVSVAIGVAQVGTDCEGEACRDNLTSDGFSEGFAGLAKDALGLIVKVGSKFIPGGLSGSSAPAPAPIVIAPAPVVPPHTHEAGNPIEE